MLDRKLTTPNLVRVYHLEMIELALFRFKNSIGDADFESC